MADLTPAEAAVFQARLANEHRLSLQQITMLTITELSNLFRAIQDDSDKVWAASLRQGIPKIIEGFAPAATTLAAAFYANSRKIFIMSGQAPKNIKDFSPKATDFLKSEAPKKIIEATLEESFYYGGQAINGNYTRSQTETPIKQLAEKAVFQFSREPIDTASLYDDFAKDEARRNVRVGGCAFCKNMAVKRGTDQVFHKGCSCVQGPAWKNEYENVPAWVAQFEEDKQRAYDEIQAYNATLKEESKTYVSERINSKGKLVKETKRVNYFVDADGNRTDPIKPTEKNILAKINSYQRERK